MAACTWTGVTRRGAGPDGTDIAPASLPASVEARCRQGWKHLAVTAAGNGRARRAGRG